jgi:hypothetical protein
MRANVRDILKLLKFVRPDIGEQVVPAEKLFIANRVLNIAYDKVDKGVITLDKLSHYIQALIEYRDDKLEIRFDFNEQTGEDEVYFKRLEGSPESIYSRYAKQFRHSNLYEDLKKEEDCHAKEEKRNTDSEEE